jgi:hypothetical protein
MNINKPIYWKTSSYRGRITPHSRFLRSCLPNLSIKTYLLNMMDMKQTNGLTSSIQEVSVFAHF